MVGTASDGYTKTGKKSNVKKQNCLALIWVLIWASFSCCRPLLVKSDLLSPKKVMRPQGRPDRGWPKRTGWFRAADGSSHFYGNRYAFSGQVIAIFVKSFSLSIDYSLAGWYFMLLNLFGENRQHRLICIFKWNKITTEQMHFIGIK